MPIEIPRALDAVILMRKDGAEALAEQVRNTAIQFKFFGMLDGRHVYRP